METRSGMTPAMALALDANFGSVARWREELVAMGAAHAGGWGRLVFRPGDGSLVNQWVADPAASVADGVALLALDLGEPFMDSIDWTPVYERYQHAVDAASEAFGAAQDDVADALVLDVRRAGVFDQDDALIAGARWSDPARVGQWADELPADREILVYCVYGHEVGRATALRLRAAGLKARFLRGGIDAWKAAGGALQPKERKPS